LGEDEGAKRVNISELEGRKITRFKDLEKRKKKKNLKIWNRFE
jgi:hypothetical protein